MSASFEERVRAELRRGVLQLAVLAVLREPTYGYHLAATLGEMGLPVEEGTLYPILRRLAKEGLLASEWDTSGARPRKYYRTTDAGAAALSALVTEWCGVNASLDQALAAAGLPGTASPPLADPTPTDAESSGAATNHPGTSHPGTTHPTTPQEPRHVHADR